jgi:cytochrome c biogenesis protein
VSYAGDLGLNSGTPQSVYNLDTSHMRRLTVSPRPLAPGQSNTLPNGLGKLTFTGYRQWVSLAITYDPGQLPALVSALTALAGLILSFLVRRRRIFVRATAAEPLGSGDSVASAVEIGGLTRSDAAGGFETEFAELSSEIMQEVRGNAAAVGQPGGEVAAAGAAAARSEGE